MVSHLKSDEWWRKSLRFISGEPQYESRERDPAKIVRVKRSLGFNAEHIGVGGKLHELYPEEPEFFQRYLDEAHKIGFRVIVYFNVHAYEPEFLKEHPDWIQKRWDGSYVNDLYGFRVGPCVNSPYREWAFNQTRRLAKSFEIDGIFLDGPCYYPGACYCKYCIEKFRERYGTNPPGWETWKDPLWSKFLEFRYESIAEFLRDFRIALREVKPNAIIYMNANGLWPAWPNARDNRRLSMHQNLLGAEGGFIFYVRPSEVPYWKAGATAKLLETQGRGIPTVVFIAGDHKPWDKYPLTESEIRLLIAETVANGANPWYSVQRNIDAAAEVMRFIEEHEDCYEGTISAARVGLVWSNRTADFYGSEIPEIDFLPPGSKVSRADMVRNFSDAFYGFYEALFRSHIPFDVIDDITIEEGIPEKYEVIVLPNVACLSDKGADEIRKFLAKGGNVVATFETSLYDESGFRRDDYALCDCLGVKSAGRILGPFQWDYVHLKRPHPILEGISLDDIPAPSLGAASHVVDAECIAMFREKAPGRYVELQPLSRYPAITVRKYYEGALIYMAGAFDVGYWIHRLREYRLILSNAVRLKRSACFIDLENAPQTLEVTVRSQGNRLILHFVNFTGEMSRPFEQIIPVYNLGVRIHKTFSAKEVKALWSNKKIEFKETDKEISFVIPKIGFYEVVVIE